MGWHVQRPHGVLRQLGRLGLLASTRCEMSLQVLLMLRSLLHHMCMGAELGAAPSVSD